MGREDRKPSTAPNARGPPSVSEQEPAIRQGRRTKGGTDEAAQLRRQTARKVALGARATTPSRGHPRGVFIGRTKDQRAFEEGGVKASTTGRRKPGRLPRARGPPTTEGGSNRPRSQPGDQMREGKGNRRCSTTDAPPLRRKSTGPSPRTARSRQLPDRSIATGSRPGDSPLERRISVGRHAAGERVRPATSPARRGSVRSFVRLG